MDDRWERFDMSGVLQMFGYGRSGGVVITVPDAPTIGTATVTGSTTATVAYTAPANDGGSTITSYTATSSPGGITGTLSQAGSGTITVSGLSSATSYTFTVTATNAVGTSAPSAASNSITTTPVIGQAFLGGYYAGQISTTANGVATHNLIVAPLSSGQTPTGVQWRAPPAATANTLSVIDGPTNSAQQTNVALYQAGGFCEGLSIGGYTDWYLPALYELVTIYYNLKPTTQSNDTAYGANAYAVPPTSNYTSGTPAQTSAAAFQVGNSEAFDVATQRYYTSTSDGSVNAYSMFFGSGPYDLGSQMNPYLARAIRRVPV
jgi:hypothetical protein